MLEIFICHSIKVFYGQNEKQFSQESTFVLDVKIFDKEDVISIL